MKTISEPGIRSNLEQILPVMVEHWKTSRMPITTWRWPHPYALVLDQGHEYTQIAPKPKGARWGRPKQCYYNAWQYATRYPDLRYCEGYAHAIHISHAWCLTPDGKIIDPTYRGTPGPSEIPYLGIPIKLDLVNAYLARTGEIGSVIEDWRGKYPLLRMDPKDFLAEPS